MRPALFVPLLAFEVRWLDPHEHSATNLGDTKTHAIFLELKDPSRRLRTTLRWVA